MALGEVVTNLPPSTPCWKGLGNRSLDLLAPQPLQLKSKTGLLTLRRYSRFWDVLMNSMLRILAIQVESRCSSIVEGLNKPRCELANAARNIEILREMSSQNNKRNRDGDPIRPTAQDSNQRGYDQKGYDGRSYDRQGANSNQKSWQNQGQQYTHSSGSSGQKIYPDYASSPPCDNCGKLLPGKACHRMGGNGGRGNENKKQPDAKGQVFSLTKDQAANSSGPFENTLLNVVQFIVLFDTVQHIPWFLFHITKQI
ncbi:hypothetical protein Tco_0608961 [Tanacetum coccineum]